jgi:hypothetical protein
LSSLQNLRQNKRNLCLNLGLAPKQWNKPRVIRIPPMEEMTGPVAGVSSQMLHHLYKLLLLPKNHSSLQRTPRLQVFLTRWTVWTSTNPHQCRTKILMEHSRQTKWCSLRYKNNSLIPGQEWTFHLLVHSSSSNKTLNIPNIRMLSCSHLSSRCWQHKCSKCKSKWLRCRITQLSPSNTKWLCSSNSNKCKCKWWINLTLKTAPPICSLPYSILQHKRSNSQYSLPNLILSVTSLILC